MIVSDGFLITYHHTIHASRTYYLPAYYYYKFGANNIFQWTIRFDARARVQVCEVLVPEGRMKVKEKEGLQQVFKNIIFAEK